MPGRRSGRAAIQLFSVSGLSCESVSRDHDARRSIHPTSLLRRKFGAFFEPWIRSRDKARGGVKAAEQRRIGAEDQARMVRNFRRTTLVDSLLLVLASADEQVSALPSFVCVADEVATTFGSAFLLVPQLERAGLVFADAGYAPIVLDEFLERMPDDAGLEDAESLARLPFWAEARRLAKLALDKLGEKWRPPKLSGVVWVRGC